MDKQVPLLLGLNIMEYLASRVIHWLFGRAGQHLFLTDSEEGKPPLLLRMITDSSNLHFMYTYVNYFLLFSFLTAVFCKLHLNLSVVDPGGWVGPTPPPQFFRNVRKTCIIS
jgi:Putative serine esterase (DUF676)